MTARASAGLSAEPNLTPILDMVFQLITFFMLVISFKTAAMDPSVKLPIAGSAQPKLAETERNFVVLNIDSAGNLRVLGETIDLEKYLADEALVLNGAARPSATDEPPILTAVIRADQETAFTELNRVIAACKAHGFRNVTFKVREPQA